MKFLGRPPLSWCRECNLAVLDSDTCPKCRKETDRVNYFFDIRPAFPYDLDNLKKTVDDQFGEGCYRLLVPDDRVVLFGIEFRFDAGYKVICDGQIIGDFFASDGRWTFSPTTRSASAMMKRGTKHTVTVTKRGLSMAVRHRGVFGKDIVKADPDIVKGDVVFICVGDNPPGAIGYASVDGTSLAGNEGKLSIRDTFAIKSSVGIPEKGYSWEETVSLNKGPLDAAVKASTDFVRRVIKKHKGLPYTVSLSGGKDSLATLLLVMKAGFKPTILYADTHMDCGSSDLVKGLAKRYGLKIITYGIPEEVFYRNLVRLGPPATDYRWCCKVHQLAVFNILGNSMGSKSLTFVGQRRFEGKRRMLSGSEWVNPSAPNQFCASPVQEWNALHVWMFLTREKAPYNKLYEQGFDRIGCYWCPIEQMTYLRHKNWTDPVAVNWKNAIDEYGRTMDMPQVWHDKMLWQYRKHSEDLPGVDHDVLMEIDEKQKIITYPTRIDGDTAYCRHWFDPSDVLPLLPIMGLKGSMKDGCLVTDDVSVSQEGQVTVVGNHENLYAKASEIFDLAMMATMCLECTVCVHTCRNSALTLKDQKIHLDASKCDGCRRCVPICPAVYILRPRKTK